MKRSFLIVIVMLLLAHFALAAETPIWVEADGEAYQSEIDTPKEVMERARRDAQSKAIQQATGVFLKSHTLVSNSQLMEDLIYASVRGRIEKVSILGEAWDEKDRNIYRVRVNALVTPVYPERGEGLVAKLSLSKGELKEGEEVQIFYEVNRDCYVYVFSIAADGSVTLLLPNSKTKENFTKGGKTYQFPPLGGPIKLKAMFLPGYKGLSTQEKIKLIASNKEEELLSLGFKEGLFQVYDAKSTGMISDLVKRLNQIDISDWTEITAIYKIRR